MKIEIIKKNIIENGIEVFAKAWDVKGKQIGFGKDGTIDIERFIFRNIKDRPLEPELKDTIRIGGKDGKNIIKGKVGNTVSTFYPSFDAIVKRIATESITSLRDGAGTASDGTINSFEIDLAGAVSATPTFKRMTRAVIEWDTSALPDTDVIDSAVFSFYGTGGFNEFTGNVPAFAITQGALATAGAVVNGDYDSNVGATRFASDIAFASLSLAGAYNDMALNATGIAAISKTGDTLICCKTSSDADGSAPTVAIDNKEFRVEFSPVEVAGTTQDPKLVVTHSVAPASSENALSMSNF